MFIVGHARSIIIDETKSLRLKRTAAPGDTNAAFRKLCDDTELPVVLAALAKSYFNTNVALGLHAASCGAQNQRLAASATNLGWPPLDQAKPNWKNEPNPDLPIQWFM